MISSNVEVVFNKKVMNGLTIIPDSILYLCAKQTLDLSRPIIPKDTGKMRTSTASGGVRGGNGNYYIGSYTGYASKVWNYPDRTNWTTPGTNNKWFARTLKRYNSVIVNNAINQSWRKDMQ